MTEDKGKIFYCVLGTCGMFNVQCCHPKQKSLRNYEYPVEHPCNLHSMQYICRIQACRYVLDPYPHRSQTNPRFLYIRVLYVTDYNSILLVPFVIAFLILAFSIHFFECIGRFLKSKILIQDLKNVIHRRMLIEIQFLKVDDQTAVTTI